MDATQTPLSGTETLLIGLAVCVVVILSATWELVRHFHTIAHEGMHAAVGSLSGRTVKSIELKSNADGETLVARKPGPGALMFLFAGYLGSSAFGLGAARLIQFGHIIEVLWLTMLLLGLVLIRLKPRTFGYVTIPLAGFLVFVVIKHTSQTGQIVAAYAITWFLLLSGVRQVLQHGANASDAGALAKRTSIPKIVWFALWLTGTVLVVAIGTKWMLHPAVHPPARQ